jgi:hypothetical protein
MYVLFFWLPKRMVMYTLIYAEDVSRTVLMQLHSHLQSHAINARSEIRALYMYVIHDYVPLKCSVIDKKR